MTTEERKQAEELLQRHKSMSQIICPLHLVSIGVALDAMEAYTVLRSTELLQQRNELKEEVERLKDLLKHADGQIDFYMNDCNH